MKNSTDERAVFYSIAISLKRIADALDSETGPHLSIREAVSQVAYKHGINSR